MKKSQKSQKSLEKSHEIYTSLFFFLGVMIIRDGLERIEYTGFMIKQQQKIIFWDLGKKNRTNSYFGKF